jgi:hypothetical protein
MLCPLARCPLSANSGHRAYSITSLALASSVGGTERLSVLAVLRLITSSYLVGACTGTLTYSCGYLMLVFITSSCWSSSSGTKPRPHRTLGIAVQRPCLFRRHHHRCSLDRFSCAPRTSSKPPRGPDGWSEIFNPFPRALIHAANF